MTSFSIILALGSVLGLIWIVLETPSDDQLISLNAGIWALVGALIGGRVAYVAVNWEYFQNHIFEIFQVWLGGLAWPGVLAGGIVATFIVAWLYDIPVGKLADRTIPLLASLSVAVWLGCWMNGCAYGPETALGLPVKDEWGILKNRLPLQLIGAILTVALFWGIDRFRHREGGLIPGLAASLGLGGLSLILLGASLLRVDPYPLYNGIRLETWAALLFLGIAVISGILAILRDST